MELISFCERGSLIIHRNALRELHRIQLEEMKRYKEDLEEEDKEYKEDELIQGIFESLGDTSYKIVED